MKSPLHVTANSKEVRPGSIFFALQGAKFDGHQFIDDAIAKGAVKVYSERDLGRPDVEPLGKNARKKLAELASEMNGNPTHRLKMIGITGTSGKTTTTFLTRHLITSLGGRCALIGTNGAEFEGRNWPTENTTPDAISLHARFAEFESLGATHVVMEVSSHALVQDRAWGIEWDACVFLNLSPEHLDYHADLNDYFSAKKMLFREHVDYSLGQGKKPVLFANAGNAFGERLVREIPSVTPYSSAKEVKDLKDTWNGIAGSLHLNGGFHSFECPLFGDFQIDNILAAFHAAHALFPGQGEKLIDSLSTFKSVPGRMEYIPNRRGIFAFVDYAHKPEALEKVLLSVQSRRQNGAKLITVFGCGGDRDKTKRPVMGKIATTLSDHVVITSDNPRTESPDQILNEIVAGTQGSKNFEVIADRAQAISRAVSIASPGDTIIVAGKGHEDYQIIGTQKRHFDDREELTKALG